MDQETEVLKILFARYLNLVLENQELFEGQPKRCSHASLVSLLTEAVDNLGKYPKDKMHRWLGFVQGVLASLRIIDVDEEREFTRPLLHSYHEETPPSFG